ncbi:cGMP-dependent protein kinase 1 [Aulostomus maculatus]
MGTLRDLQFALQLKIEELRQRDTLIDELELELDAKDELIRRLQEELDRYRASVSLPGSSAGAADCSAQHEDNVSAHRKTIMSESFSLDPVTLATVFHRLCDKSQASKRLIQAAFLKSDLLKNLDEGEVRAMIMCMHLSTVHPGCRVIQEGTSGANAYVVEEGSLDVTRDGLNVLTLGPEDMFGEAALLYDCTHTCSVSAQTDSKLWVIDRKSYRTVLTQRALSSLYRSSELLSSVPCLQSLPGDVIMKMSDLMEEARYTEGEVILGQGALGDTFYIISKGQVKVTEQKPGQEEQVALSTLSERQWFGERALWGEDVRTVNVIAAGDVTCLLIDRETFRSITGGSVFDSSHEVLQNTESRAESDKDASPLSSATLSDFQILCTLGVGEFGHVDLVQLKSGSKCLYSMRVLKTKLILHRGQRERILRERRVFTEARSPFIIRLHKTFRDAESLYMLTEACLHGDLYSLVKEKGGLDECSSKFYAACLVEALTFLHSRSIIYRDVKPENVLLDECGYAKLAGFTCSKKLKDGKKTFTFCGSLGYMAPEVILNKGHSVSADLWSLGVFVFELLSGGVPFRGSEPVRILTATIRGIDQIDFPKTISKSASSLIKNLCRHNPSERLGSRRNGAKDIQKHKWFQGFSWDGLSRRTLRPPLTPQVTHVPDGGGGYYDGGAAELCTTWDDF